MKKIIYTIIICYAFFNLCNAQYCGTTGTCTASGPLSQPGFSPAGYCLGPIVIGASNSITIQFQNWDTISVQGTILHVNSLQISKISNLPPGLCWTTNKSDNTFATSENGCLQINGTVTGNVAGQYQLGIYVNMNTVELGNLVDINMAAFGLFYYARAINSGDNCPHNIDTTGQASGTGDTIQLYTQGVCPNTGVACQGQPGSFSVAMGGNVSLCSGSQVIFNPVVSGGMPPYSYSWGSTGNSLSCSTCSTPSVTITQNSTFTLTVTDHNGSFVADTVNYTLNGSGSTLLPSVTNTNLSCASYVDTTTLAATGGSGPYTINWDNGTFPGSANLPATGFYNSAGVYVIGLTDANGCISDIFDTILNTGVNVSLVQAIQPACSNQNTGSLTVSASGGVGPYTYKWSYNGLSGAQLTNIPNGYYQVTVTDAASCSATFQYTLYPSSSSWALYTFVQETDANCSNNGTALAYAYGGITPYSFNWSNGGTTDSINSLAPGSYNVTVTDSVGCQAEGKTYISANCASIISGHMFVDLNQNCVFDSGETGVSNNFVIATAVANGATFYGYTDETGFYSIEVNDSGTYMLQFYGPGNGACTNASQCGNSTQTVFIDSLGAPSLNNNFAAPVSSGFDLTMHPGWSSADPGFQKEYWIMPYNQTNSPFSGTATVIFSYDPHLIYQYSLAPLPLVDTLAHTLTWTVNDIPSPWFDWTVRFENFFLVPDTLSVGYLLQSDFWISPTTGDCDSSNNHLHFSETVIGSHDPNEKDVEPANNISPDDSVLTYTIHFQNTGSDSTNFIVVKDTLSSGLDASTVRNLAASYKYSDFTVSGQGILTWTFNPYRLPDSATNPAGSKGFITFSVQKKGNLPLGTQISNTASITFDYNTAIVTNTVTDTVAYPAGIIALHNAANNISVQAYPNPFNDATTFVVSGMNQPYDFELYDLTGRLVHSIPNLNTGQFILQRDNMAAGIYMYRITTRIALANGSRVAAFGKLVMQ